MSNFFANKRLILLLLSLIILVIVMGSTLRDRPQPTWPEKFVIDSVSWLQGLVYQPANAVAGFFEDVGSMYRLYEENKALKASLEQFAQVTADRYRIEQENKRLREMLDARSSSGYELLFADVIARSPDQWNHTITINRGVRDGLTDNMAVITAQGFIGRVQSVSNFYSQVELLTDLERGYFISSVIQAEENEVYGVVEEYDESIERLIMRKIPVRQDFQVGDRVVTSGLGGVFPEGLVIGEVTKIIPENYGLTQVAYIKPDADFQRLGEVFIVKNPEDFPPSSELKEDEE